MPLNSWPTQVCTVPKMRPSENSFSSRCSNSRMRKACENARCILPVSAEGRSAVFASEHMLDRYCVDGEVYQITGDPAAGSAACIITLVTVGDDPGRDAHGRHAG